MSSFEELYKEDQKHIRLWEENYTDKEFYKINKNIRKKIEVLIEKRKTFSSREHFIIAIIYHHAFNISCSKKALKHIKKAQDLGYSKQKWLIASITDRLLQLQKKPQKYGTQIIKLKDGKYRQYKLDNSINDKQRNSLGLPSLKQLKKELEN